MGLLHAFFPSIELPYWTEFWIIVGFFVLMGFLCLILVKNNWLKFSLAGLFVLLSFPLTSFVYMTPYYLGTSEFNKSELVDIVRNEIDKGKISIKKQLPFFSFWIGRFRNLGQVLNYEQCGTLCENLVTQGFVNQFHSKYVLPTGNVYKIVTVDLDLNKTVENSSSKDFRNAQEVIKCYTIEKPNKWYAQFKYKNRFYVCHINGAFVSIFGAIDYRASDFRPIALHHPTPDTLKIYLNWFQIYPILEETL